MDNADNTSWTARPGKDRRGHFVPGHQLSLGNRGNYHPRDTLRTRLVKATTFEEVKEVMDKLYSQALSGGKGSIHAARLWLEYVLGRAPQALELSSPDRPPLFTSVILPVLMSVIDKYPGARAEMVAAIEQFQLEQYDRGDAAASTPEGR
jgi:hypothetical protein